MGKKSYQTPYFEENYCLRIYLKLDLIPQTSYCNWKASSFWVFGGTRILSLQTHSMVTSLKVNYLFTCICANVERDVERIHLAFEFWCNIVNCEQTLFLLFFFSSFKLMLLMLWLKDYCQNENQLHAVHLAQVWWELGKHLRDMPLE